MKREYNLNITRMLTLETDRLTYSIANYVTPGINIIYIAGVCVEKVSPNVRSQA